MRSSVRIKGRSIPYTLDGLRLLANCMALDNGAKPPYELPAITRLRAQLDKAVKDMMDDCDGRKGGGKMSDDSKKQERTKELEA